VLFRSLARVFKMPYLEDGETWSNDADVFEEGMAENKPAHRKFSTYNLPNWSKHPLTHPFNGIVAGPKEYMYTAGDGFVNPLGWSIAHVGAKHGDMAILELATEEELSRQNVEGMTPASYSAQFGTSWCLQWFVENGADVTTPDINGVTPEDHIWRNPRLHIVEQEWLFSALKGELTEKNSIKAQEYALVKSRAVGADPKVAERLDLNMRKLRKYHYGMGDYELAYPPPAWDEERTLDLPVSKVEPLAKVKVMVPVALLFPGQGSQYVKMMSGLKDLPKVQEMCAKANEILGYDLLDLCLNGPEEKLEQTRYCQPALFVASLAGLEKLRTENADAATRFKMCAGLSLGEYSALCAAGVFTFEDGLKLVQLRGEAMQEAAQQGKQLMLSVAGIEKDKLEKLCKEAAKKEPNGVAVIANELFPKGFACAGTEKAINALKEAAEAAGALQAKVLKTSGAFHSSLMAPAGDKLAKALDEVLPRMKPPEHIVYMNVTAKPLKVGADPKEILPLLKQQLTSPVLWEPLIKNMIGTGITEYYEVGPMKQLKAMMKRIDAKVWNTTTNVEV